MSNQNQEESYFLNLVLKTHEWLQQNAGTRIIYLEGPLGVGKTQFVKELLEFYGLNRAIVQSPTFLKMLEYEVPDVGLVLHLDCYRMTELSDLEHVGLENYLDLVSLIIVEWPELFKNYVQSSLLGNQWLMKYSQLTLDIKSTRAILS